MFDNRGGIRLGALTKNPMGERLVEQLSTPDKPPSQIEFESFRPDLFEKLRRRMEVFNEKTYSSKYHMDSISKRGEPVESTPLLKGSYYGASSSNISLAFTAKYGTAAGTIMLLEQPLMSCKASVAGVIESFLELRDDIIQIMKAKNSAKVRVDLLSQDDQNELLGALKLLTNKFKNNYDRQHLYQALCWWYSALKSYSWTHPDDPERWFFYRTALHLPVSCVPNCIVRYLPGGICAIVAISRLERGEVLSISVPQLTLYASTPYRRTEVLQTNCLVCMCPRCRAPADASRRIWCPGCRRKMETFGQMTSRAPFALSVAKSWCCPACKESFNDDLSSGQIEAVLDGAFSKVQGAYDEGNQQTWLGHVAYVQAYTCDALSPHHWLILGVHHVLAEFYLWKSQKLGRSKDNKYAAKLGLWYGMKFIEALNSRIEEEAQLLSHHYHRNASTGGMFVQIAAPILLEMMIACLDICELGLFTSLVDLYLPTVLLQYGSDYPPIAQCLLPAIYYMIRDNIRRATGSSAKSKYKKLVERFRHLRQIGVVSPNSINNNRDIDGGIDKLVKLLREYPGLKRQWESPPWETSKYRLAQLPITETQPIVYQDPLSAFLEDDRQTHTGCSLSVRGSMISGRGSVRGSQRGSRSIACTNDRAKAKKGVFSCRR